MSIIFIEQASTNSPHLFIETVWPCYTVQKCLYFGLLKIMHEWFMTDNALCVVHSQI